jgi:two-component system, OmpR family, response regulator
MEAPRVLLVDDDAVLCQVLAEYLQAHGFDVTVAHDGEIGFAHATEGDYDLAILDDTLPGLTKTDVLRRIRSHGELPVVMLSSGNDDVDRIVALELGADDCLCKSCNLRELVARLHTILRRTRHAMAQERTRKQKLAALSLCPIERRVMWRGEPLQLTSTEFNLLHLLFENPGRAISKAELAVNVLGRELDRFDRSLDMHISNLRKKLGTHEDGRSPIQSVRGAGYQLIPI